MLYLKGLCVKQINFLWVETGYDCLKKIDWVHIVAVADCFGAITSTIFYRSDMSLEEAVDEIRRHAGTQFDLEVVDVFLVAVKRPGVRDQGSGRIKGSRW